MPPSSLMVCPVADVQRLAGQIPGVSVIGMLSPNMGHPPIEPAPRRRLALAFNDMVALDPRKPRRSRPYRLRGRLHHPPVLVNPRHVQAILDFAAKSPPGPMLIYCYRGVSRSTAAAYIIRCALAAPGHEPALAARLKAMSPEARPNARMLAIGDALLGRDGRLARCFPATGAGYRGPSAVAFEWPAVETVTT